MGRPGRDPRPAPRYAAQELALQAAAAARASTRPTSPTSRRTCATRAPSMTAGADRPAPARLRGPDRLAARRRRPRQEAGQDAARDRAAEEHADRVPLRQRLDAGRAPHPRRQVPPLRGVAAHPADRARPRRARPARPCAGRSPTSTSRRRWSTRPTRGPGARWTASRCCRRSATRASGPKRTLEIEALGAAVRGRHPGQRVGPALQGRAHRPLHVRRLHGDRRAGALRPPQGPVPADATSPASPAYAQVKAKLAAKLAQARPLQGPLVPRQAVRVAASWPHRRPPRPSRRRPSARHARPACTTRATARSSS